MNTPRLRGVLPGARPSWLDRFRSRARSLTTKTSASLLLFASGIGASGLGASACSTVVPADAQDEGYESAASGLGEEDGSDDEGASDGDEDGGDESGDDSGDTGTDAGGDGDGDGDGDGTAEEIDPIAPHVCSAEDVQSLELMVADANTWVSGTAVRHALLDPLASAPLPPVALSPRPFLNYYRLGPEEAPSPEAGPELSAEFVPIQEGATGRYRLQVCLRAPALDPADRPRMHMVAVLDRSPELDASLAQLQFASLSALAGGLRPGDRFAVVDSEGESWLEPVQLAGAPGDASTLVGELMAAIVEAASPEAGDALEPSLAEAYELVSAMKVQSDAEEAGPSREQIVVLTEGAPNLGGAIASQIDIHANAADPIFLAAVGLAGPERSLAAEAAHDAERIGDLGRSASLLIDSEEEAKRRLAEGFDALFLSRLEELEFELDLPPSLRVIGEDISGGEIAPPPVESLRLGPGGRVVHHIELESCVAEDSPSPSSPEPLPFEGALQLRVHGIDALQGEPFELPLELPLAGLDSAYASPDLEKGAAIVGYARALSTLRHELDPAAQEISLLEGLGLIFAALETQPEDLELLEMLEVLSAAYEN